MQYQNMNNSNAEIQSALWDMFLRFNIGTNHANVLAYETLALHITIMKNPIKLIVMFYFEIHFLYTWACYWACVYFEILIYTGRSADEHYHASEYLAG